jgi:hypothetical protein
MLIPWGERLFDGITRLKNAGRGKSYHERKYSLMFNLNLADI